MSARLTLQPMDGPRERHGHLARLLRGARRHCGARQPGRRLHPARPGRHPAQPARAAAHPEQGEGDVELNFATPAPLDDLQADLEQVGVEIVTPTTDEGFGRQLQVRSPSGLLVKINELEPELYT